MTHTLVPATAADKAWLEQLRRDVYREMFVATFGDWDEVRHQRQFAEFWDRGHIWIVEVDHARVGTIQLFDRSAALELGEFQIDRVQQNRGIGSRVLRDVLTLARDRGKRQVRLTVGLKNHRARRLYERLGFRTVTQNETHYQMACDVA